MRRVIAFANGIIKKITVSKKTGIPKKKLPVKKANGALLIPTTANKDRIMRSAAPEDNIHFPIMAAIAIKIPTLAQVFPNSVVTRSPKLFLAKANAAAGFMPLDNPNCSIADIGVKYPTNKAANKSAKNGCSLKPMIPPTTINIPIHTIMIGSSIRLKIKQ